MRDFREIQKWLEDHRDLGYGMVRVYLGIALTVRGLLMLLNPESIARLAGEQQLYMYYAYIVGAHLVGGLLLAMGMWTRLAALVQIPVLVGAIVLIHLGQGLMTAGQSLELASLVLILLSVFAIFGSGPLSVRTWMGWNKRNVQHV